LVSFGGELYVAARALCQQLLQRQRANSSVGVSGAVSMAAIWRSRRWVETQWARALTLAPARNCETGMFTSISARIRFLISIAISESRPRFGNRALSLSSAAGWRNTRATIAATEERTISARSASVA